MIVKCDIRKKDTLIRYSISIKVSYKNRNSTTKSISSNLPPGKRQCSNEGRTENGQGITKKRRGLKIYFRIFNDWDKKKSNGKKKSLSGLHTCPESVCMYVITVAISWNLK